MPAIANGAVAQSSVAGSQMANGGYQVANFETWETEKKRYALKGYGGGTFAYELKEAEANGEPIHRACLPAINADVFQSCKTMEAPLVGDRDTPATLANRNIILVNIGHGPYRRAEG
ncbi:MAG: hypothetical protein WA767_02455 [Pseudolabrys sp.]